MTTEMATPRITAVLEDVNGDFRRLYEQVPKDVRARLSHRVLASANRVARRMGETAPRGPDAPHIADKVTFTHRGLSARVGYIAGEGGYGDMPANDNLGGAGPTIAQVALFNEYRVKPGNRPFMRPALEGDSSLFLAEVTEVLRSLADKLS